MFAWIRNDVQIASIHRAFTALLTCGRLGHFAPVWRSLSHQRVTGNCEVVASSMHRLGVVRAGDCALSKTGRDIVVPDPETLRTDGLNGQSRREAAFLR
jgi:hypothetical protein